MKILVQCSNKAQNLEGESIVTQVTFQPYNDSNRQYATGAAIGTPNSPAGTLQDQPALQTPSVSVYNLSGGFMLTIRDEQEAAKYTIKEIYSVAFEPAKVEPQKTSNAK